MYRLNQAACLAHDDLVLHLSKYGYSPDKICPNIWTHKQRKTKFCLCPLHQRLKSKYEIITDMTSSHFCGLTLKWNYTHGYIDLSMPGFVKKTLKIELQTHQEKAICTP